ncbi:hypothetical protein [Streptomyces sp. NBC_00102]|uniref:hypothetical protein n=1 Tax=Streptomyces sp. NBC_00102 TaxID=2975652 RepID=UPI002256A151|nr:hypothetical protein [Streptomyces sp. NBC_00102]MCX5397947.1 hypothetical protein [Streptomyces sp. NBC_00102]
MRASLVRRSALAASVASLVLLATACGGSSDDSDSKSKAGDTSKSASAESAAPEQSDVKALTAAELEKVSLAQGDVADLKIENAGAEDILKASDVTSDKAECLPFAHALFAVPQGKPVATTARTAMAEPKASDTTTSGDASEKSLDDAMGAALNVSSTMVSLGSYEGGDAADVLAAVRKAATACASGFTATVQGEAQKLSAITEQKVAGGEEAVAWNVVEEQEGESFPFGLVVVRQGSTVSTFTTVNMAAAMDPSVKVEQPTALVAAQVKKVS